MAKFNEADLMSHNRLSNGTVIEGTITGNGDFRFDGTLTGNLTTKGKVVIGATGKVAGELTCKSSDIEGKVEGKITTNELLSLRATADIKGDIVTTRLAIEPGAKFSGTCNMTDTSANESTTFRKGEPKEGK